MIDRLGNEVPVEALPFAKWVEQHGWHYMREWTWPWEDEDGYHEGFWTEAIWHEVVHEWPREDDVWFFALTVTDHIMSDERMWPRYLELAQAASEADRTSCRVHLPEEVYAKLWFEE